MEAPAEITFDAESILTIFLNLGPNSSLEIRQPQKLLELLIVLHQLTILSEEFWYILHIPAQLVEVPIRNRDHAKVQPLAKVNGRCKCERWQ